MEVAKFHWQFDIFQLNGISEHRSNSIRTEACLSTTDGGNIKSQFRMLGSKIAETTDSIIKFSRLHPQ